MRCYTRFNGFFFPSFRYDNRSDLFLFIRRIIEINKNISNFELIRKSITYYSIKTALRFVEISL